jgi:hypothetical protein
VFTSGTGFGSGFGSGFGAGGSSTIGSAIHIFKPQK